MILTPTKQWWIPQCENPSSTAQAFNPSYNPLSRWPQSNSLIHRVSEALILLDEALETHSEKSVAPTVTHSGWQPSANKRKASHPRFHTGGNSNLSCESCFFHSIGWAQLWPVFCKWCALLKIYSILSLQGLVVMYLSCSSWAGTRPLRLESEPGLGGCWELKILGL